jgi:IMP dehydrogenase
MEEKIIGEGITFDDVLILPDKSDTLPVDIDTSTNLTRNIRLNIPIVSAAMDTVTESTLAIAIAQEGGIGIIHRNMSQSAQVLEVTKVKRSESGIIFDPKCLSPDETIGSAKKIMREYNISGIPITKGTKLVGILTIRDLGFGTDDAKPIADVMTKNLITAPVGTTLESAKKILHENKIEKLLLVDSDFNLKGLITMKDINKQMQYPLACKDQRGRLRVGAAVGVYDFERAEALIKADVDVLVVDTSHGHSKNVIDTVRRLKKMFNIDVIAGNIATGSAVVDLYDAGADGVKVGIGPGSICTTRVIAGVGIPQITAIMDCARVANLGASKLDIPIIADGGIRNSGDVTKAICAGANSVMIGGLFAGVVESPGEVIIYAGRRYKSYRGMGSLGAMMKGSKARYYQEGLQDSKLVPEGIEGMVPFKGTLSDFVYQLIGGLKAGMGYAGVKNIEELRKKGKFIKVSLATLKESHPHDIIITKESPNYSVEQQETEAR